MANFTTPTPERDAQLLDIGHQCSASSCLLHDFLPFKCQHCNQPFCTEHFMPDAHKCDKYDVSKYNLVAPNCPLCNTPVAMPPGQDPNLRMERHINSECSVTTGKTKSSSVPRCTRPRCGKVLYSPIRCDSCKQLFCPQHRFPGDHSCASAAQVSSKPASKPSLATGAATTVSIKHFLNAASSSSPRPAASASARSTSITRPTPAPSKAPTAPATPSSSKPIPFSKTDRLKSPPAALHVINVALNIPAAKPQRDNNSDTSTSTRCALKTLSTNPLDPNSFVPPPLFASA